MIVGHDQESFWEIKDISQKWILEFSNYKTIYQNMQAPVVIPPG